MRIAQHIAAARGSSNLALSPSTAARAFAGASAPSSVPMRLLVVGSLTLTLTLALLLGTFLITHGHMRAGCLFLACLQIPAGAYDVATGQYGFVVMSIVGGVPYLRGWRRKEARELEQPLVPRRRAQQSQSFADGWLAGDADAGAAREPECRGLARA